MKILPKNWSEFLVSKPETGMGYQVVAVTLKDGKKFEDVAVIECCQIGEVRGHNDVPFDPNDIVKIELTHRKWNFRK